MSQKRTWWKRMMVELDGHKYVVLTLSILWSGMTHFKDFDILWPVGQEHLEEPNAPLVTAYMKENAGLLLIEGGVFFWDDDETVAMVIRLKEDEEQKQKVEPTEIPPSGVKRQHG